MSVLVATAFQGYRVRLSVYFMTVPLATGSKFINLSEVGLANPHSGGKKARPSCLRTEPQEAVLCFSTLVTESKEERLQLNICAKFHGNLYIS